MGNNLPSLEAFKRCSKDDLATLVNQIGGAYKGIAQSIDDFGFAGADCVGWDKETFDGIHGEIDKIEGSFPRRIVLWQRLERIRNGSVNTASPTEASATVAAIRSDNSRGNGSSSSGGGGGSAGSGSAGPTVTPTPVSMCATGPKGAKQIAKERRAIEVAARKAKAEARKNNSNTNINSNSNSVNSSSGENGAAAGADAGGTAAAAGVSSGQSVPGSNKKRPLSNDSAPAAAGTGTAVKPAGNRITYHDVSADHIIWSGKRPRKAIAPWEPRKKSESFKTYWQNLNQHRMSNQP